MSEKEKLIIKQLGYTTFVLYYYILHNKTFSNKEMEWELGMSKESRYRALQKLKAHGVIQVSGYCYNREFTVCHENNWQFN